MITLDMSYLRVIVEYKYSTLIGDYEFINSVHETFVYKYHNITKNIEDS